MIGLTTDRDALAAAVGSMSAAVQSRKQRLWAEGGVAAQSDCACPYAVGSWNWQRWIEGFVGAEMPTRSIVGGAFNMTPAEEVFGRTQWLKDHGVKLSEDQLVRVVALFAAGYRHEVLGAST